MAEYLLRHTIPPFVIRMRLAYNTRQMNFVSAWPVKRVAYWVVAGALSLWLTACAPSGPTPSATANVATPTVSNVTAAPLATAAPTAFAVSVTQNITYAVPLQPKVDAQALDVYAPVGHTGGPLVVFAHGLGENKPDYKRFGQALAAAGAVAYLIDWPDFALANSTSGGAREYRQVFETLRMRRAFCARATGASYGGNASHLVLSGFSLGGGMAAGLAFAPDDADKLWNDYTATSNGPAQQVQCAQGSGPASVNAFVGIAGTYLLANGPNVATSLRPLFSPAVSAAAHAHIPVRLIHGTFDSRVPLSLSEQFNAMLVGMGYDSTLTKTDGSHSVPFDQTVAAIMGLWQ